MRVIVCRDYNEMSEKGAEFVLSQLTFKPDSVLGFATGSTPLGLYNILVDKYEHNTADFSEVTTFNLDEYYPIKRSNNQSYYSFMNDNLFSKINIKPENINIMSGETENPKEECRTYSQKIKEAGGIDLQILGIGRNGHIGFNEPSENLNSRTHLVSLKEDTINANSRFFESSEDVPKYALTMGISDILEAEKIIILASGKEKSKVVRELLNENITTNNPATMLKTHKDVTLICDYEAYGE